MKECLWCKKEFKEKKPTAKYCSTSCRVMFNHKRGKIKEKVRDDVLVNMLSEMNKKLMAKIENAAFPPLPSNTNFTNGIIPTIEAITPESKYADFEVDLKKCKNYNDIKIIVAEIEKSDLGFFPKKNLKQLATDLSNDFYTD